METGNANPSLKTPALHKQANTSCKYHQKISLSGNIGRTEASALRICLRRIDTVLIFILFSVNARPRNSLGQLFFSFYYNFYYTKSSNLWRCNCQSFYKGSRSRTCRFHSYIDTFFTMDYSGRQSYFFGIYGDP